MVEFFETFLLAVLCSSGIRSSQKAVDSFRRLVRSDRQFFMLTELNGDEGRVCSHSLFHNYMFM